jgi:regulator of protease activity HflC (stomatin/prohibitin superfamily)
MAFNTQLPNGLNKLGRVAISIIVLLILAFVLNPFAIVGPSERGVKIILGEVQDGTLQPGIQTYVPLLGRVQLYSIVPSQIKMEIAVGTQGAITKDNQTVGVVVTAFWHYDEQRITEIARNYSEDSLKAVIKSTGEAAVKNAIGQYTIFDLATAQTEITEKIKGSIMESLKQYPVLVSDVKLTNYDWSNEFDKQIAETMNRAQQVRQKEQELETAKLEAQKQVAVAQAERDAAIARAEGEKQRVTLEAEAKVLEGEGIRKYNDSIAHNLNIEIRIRELEIEKIKAEKWDGQYVPNNMYGPIPFDTRGGIQR